MTSLALRAYTVGAAMLCGGSIAYSLDQQHTAQRWQSEARSWQQVANRIAVRDQTLVRRYNKLVRDANRVAALGAGPQSVAGGASAAMPAALSPAPAPATRTS